MGGGLAVLDRERAGHVDRLVGQAACLDRLVHRRQPGVAGPDVEAAGDERDPTMTEVEQVVDGLAHPVRVVGLDRARPELVGQVAVEEHDRKLELGQLLEQWPGPSRWPGTG